MVKLPQQLRMRYYFEQSLEAKIQTYFGINDLEKLKRVSRSDPFKVGDEVVVASYETKDVTKRDISKPKNQMVTKVQFLTLSLFCQKVVKARKIVTVTVVVAKVVLLRIMMKVNQSLKMGVMKVKEVINPMYQKKKRYSHKLLAEVGVM